MKNINVNALRGVSKINGNNYPMYCGFLSSDMLKTIAEVPSFAPTKQHHQIARDIHHPPVDQWQRPLDSSKTHKIKTTYSRADKDNLMANPVLIGVASPNINADVNIQVQQSTIQTVSGDVVAVPDNYILTINYSDELKPLWILDGQHRIEGMLESVQKNEPIPFVLLYHDTLYSPPLLAEIFTQVTTGATPMQSLHAEWMKYAFRLDKYSEEAHEKSMEVAIHLCKEIHLGGVNNPFHNKIQFNPYLSQPGFYAFAFNMEEWSKIIAENYYGRGGTLESLEIASEIAKLIRAAESVDQYKGQGGSKLFSNDDPHKILAEGFLSGILSYIAMSNSTKSFDEWVSYFIDPLRAFQRCDWRLPFVRSTGALSSSNGAPSKLIAKESFDVVFNDPHYLNGVLVTDFLQGVNASIKITAYPKTSAGRLSNRNEYTKYFTPGSGLIPFDTRSGDVIRDIIRIESDSPNCSIVKVHDPNVLLNSSLDNAKKRSGLDITSYSSGFEIAVTAMSYSGDTKTVTRIRLDK